MLFYKNQSDRTVAAKIYPPPAKKTSVFPLSPPNPLFSCYTTPIINEEVYTMNLTSGLDCFIAVTGILIIVVIFAWNIYEVFVRKSSHSSSTPPQTNDHSEDSAIR